MGGNLFKTNRRATKEEYLEIQNKITKALSKSGIAFRTIKSFRNKDTFGDIDILVAPKKRSLEKVIANIYPHVNDVYDNTSKDNSRRILSFGLKNSEEETSTFQADFIFCDEENLDISEFYFSYNDLNNLVGKILRYFNCSFGFEGLFYKYYPTDKSLKYRFFLTKDPRQIYQLAGLDYNRYLEGFDSLEDIYQFVVSSSKFHPGYFALYNLNHQHRVRDRKRTTYKLFLEYIEEKYDIKDDWPQLDEVNVIESFFNINLKDKIQAVDTLLEEKDNASQKMRQIASNQNRYKEKQLGDYLKFVREECFNAYLNSLNEEDIKTLINNTTTKWEKIN